jgi:hypothetical protein
MAETTMSDERMTNDDAYRAMYAFLTGMHERTGSGELGAILGMLSTLPDGSPADPAITAEWAEAVEAVRRGEVDTSLQLAATNTPQGVN